MNFAIVAMSSDHRCPVHSRSDGTDLFYAALAQIKVKFMAIPFADLTGVLRKFTIEYSPRIWNCICRHSRCFSAGVPTAGLNYYPSYSEQSIFSNGVSPFALNCFLLPSLLLLWRGWCTIATVYNQVCRTCMPGFF